MFQRLIFVLTLIALTTACAIAPTEGNFIDYQGQEMLSEHAAKELPRTERLATITEQMQSVGFEHVRVSYLYDKYSSTVLGIFENQFELMNEYKTLLDNHKDVMSFLVANKDKNKQDLEQEIERFDSTIELEQDKIGPKIKSYTQATSNIWQQNAKLTAQITVQALELGLVLYSANKSDDGVGELLVTNVLEMMLAANKMNKASKLAKIRLHLSKLANNFIEDEQAIIDISKRLQEYQDKQP